MSERQYCIYILTNPRHTVLYTGVTGNLPRRVEEHTLKTMKGFAKKYNCTKLVYAEAFDNPEEAILREKQIKGGSRQKKLDLINAMNPDWEDISGWDLL